jgi:hypothetical protein
MGGGKLRSQGKMDGQAWCPAIIYSPASWRDMDSQGLHVERDLQHTERFGGYGFTWFSDDCGKDQTKKSGDLGMRKDM